MAAPSDRFWDDLLLFIEEGKVIPVVGPELLTLRDGEHDVPLSAWLARRLAPTLDCPEADLPAGFDLNDVVSLHLRRGGERDDLYSRILRLLRDARPAPSAALLALAGIPKLDLFVSLGFDSLLADALAATRPGAVPEQIAYATNAVHDLATARDAQRQPVVFQLLGRASSSPDFAICDEDLLEWLHALQDRQRQPLKLFDELRSNHLLILGCGFGDWLARFFLRTARGLELSQKRKRWDVLVGAQAGQDPALTRFLASFSADTRLVHMPAADFVLALAQRWHAAHPATLAGSTTYPPTDHAALAAPQDGAVFISYASENRDAAQRLAGGLRAAGLDVWFDQNALPLAGDWARNIDRGIERCAAFLPVVSRESISELNVDRYFWREWNAADYRARGMAPDAEFIVPVVIDDTRLDRSTLPDSIKRKQGPSLPGGAVTPEVVLRLVEIVKNFHRRQRGAA